ncbi:MAG: hypothetical protein HYW78_03500, partial [Parcubacteria group bacterium]|nr:hypothetical protein [Parcubacteria group bacterium]
MSGIFGVNLQLSFWSLQERMTGIWTLSHFYIFLTLLLFCGFSRKEWRIITIGILTSAGIIAIYAILQSYGIALFLKNVTISRVPATFGNASFLATYLLSVIFYALYDFFDNDKNKKRKFFDLFIIGVVFIALLKTNTRGAFLALIVTGIIALILYGMHVMR